MRQELEKIGGYDLLLIMELEDVERKKDFDQIPQVIQKYMEKVNLGPLVPKIQGKHVCFFV